MYTKIADYPIADVFPFEEELVLDLNEHSGQKIVGRKAVMSMNEDGRTWDATYRYAVKDRKEFIKIFRDSVKTILKLSTTAQKVLWYVIDNLPIKKSFVIISNESCMEECGFKNRKSVRDGILELLEKKILVRSSYQSKYWVNPLVLFNGDRIEFHKEFVFEGE